MHLCIAKLEVWLSFLCPAGRGQEGIGAGGTGGSVECSVERLDVSIAGTQAMLHGGE